MLSRLSKHKTPFGIAFDQIPVMLYVTNNGLTGIEPGTLEEKWGKPVVTRKNKHHTCYEWKKGETAIHCREDRTKGSFMFLDFITSCLCFGIVARDKNVSVCGITVGTDKDKALQIMAAYGGKVFDSIFLEGDVRDVV